MYRFILLSALIALSVACSSASADDLDITGNWELISGSVDGQAIPSLDGSPVTFDVTGTQIGGTSACNSYGAQMVLDGSSISIGDLTSTLMMCSPEAMAVEVPYTAALQEVDAVSLDGGELVLTGPGIELRFALTG